VDQVYLVPDVPAAFEAIATWDEHQFFPILIDDPAWTLPFLRAFRPARVVRYRAGAGSRRPPPADGSRARWDAAMRAVARAWSRDGLSDQDLPSAASVPVHLGATPPGLVFSHPDSPTLAAAVALAAGRFQPLVELDPLPRSTSGDPAGFKGFGDVLDLAEARGFARRVELLAEAVAGPVRRLGDACDFLTLAGDWPYRYRNDAEPGLVRGEHALDDLVGRIIETDEGSLAASRRRWAFAGRIVGTPASGLYRAMCALFLLPERVMLWNTYGGGAEWSDYTMTGPSRLLGQLAAGMECVHREGSAASLSAWHQVLGPVSRFGWFQVNSSGGPKQFSIVGGAGRPSDLPRGDPAAVSMIHSFSAADPRDPATLAGRWLENGAFVYFGSMNEPYLQAFRTPGLVLALAAAPMPLAAALRQSELEPFGRPWRLVYLGDPLYTLQFSPGGARSGQDRQPPGPLATLGSGGLRLEGTLLSAGGPAPSFEGDAGARLDACMTAALQSLCRRDGPPDVRPDWPAVLRGIDRRALAPPLRAVRDELTIDAFLAAGDTEHLLGVLLKIPPPEAGRRIGLAIESLLMARLMGLASAGLLPQAMDLWDVMLGRPWPADSEFPAHFTERLAGLAASSSRDQALYVEHLRRASSIFGRSPEQFGPRDLVLKELNRLGVPAAAAGRGR
jgi:hypothetical protein